MFAMRRMPKILLARTEAFPTRLQCTARMFSSESQPDSHDKEGTSDKTKLMEDIGNLLDTKLGSMGTAIKAELGKLDTKFENIDTKIGREKIDLVKTELKGDIGSLKTDLKGDIEKLDKKVGNLEKKFDTTVGNLDMKFDTKLGNLDTKFGNLDTKLGSMKTENRVLLALLGLGLTSVAGLFSVVLAVIVDLNYKQMVVDLNYKQNTFWPFWPH
jgi:hypothetical protein